MPVDTELEGVLNFRGSMWDCRPRMLWQRLFNFYRKHECPLDHMDNMVIDLRNCEEVFQALTNRGDTVRFIWACAAKWYSTTWRPEADWIHGDAEFTAKMLTHDVAILCEVTRDQATFKRLTVDPLAEDTDEPAPEAA